MAFITRDDYSGEIVLGGGGKIRMTINIIDDGATFATEEGHIFIDLTKTQVEELVGMLQTKDSFYLMERRGNEKRKV